MLHFVTRFSFSILLLLIPFATTFAQQSIGLVAGARGAAMGRTGVNFTDIHAAFSNQAGLAGLNQLAIGVIGERPFSLAAVNHVGAAVALPTSGGTFALSAQYYGVEAYNEQRLGLAYARTLVKGLRLGAQFDILSTHIPTYGNALHLTVELGLQYQLFDEITLGAHVFSPVTIQVTEEDEIPPIFQLGASYMPSKKILLNVEVAQEVAGDTRFKTGLEYQIADPLLLRLGLATNPSLVTFGIGYQLKNGLGIDVAASYHQVLGFSPTVGITFVP